MASRPRLEEHEGVAAAALVVVVVVAVAAAAVSTGWTEPVKLAAQTVR